MVAWAFRSLSSLVICASVLVLGAPSVNNIVDLGYAKYTGNFTAPHSVAYLGLPYAEPPVGDRRWRAPVTLDTRRISREAGGRAVDAKSYPNFCIQASTGAGDAGGAGSEDCLKVNVYTPAGAKRGDNLPVLVYIHGGGYFYGNPANWPFDHWINQSPNVIVVSVYYRLSSFGFLAHSGFASDKSLGDLNTGFLDQREALRWVQKYISAFGGNPNQVTINGESAGGGSVQLHLVAKNEDNLFQAAIAQSVYRHPVQDPKLQEPQFDFFAAQAGCGSGSTADKMACLRKASVSAIARAQDAPFTGAWNSWHPVRDVNTIVEPPTESFKNGRFKKIPVIVGAVSNETVSTGTIAQAWKNSFPALTDQDITDLLAQYPLSAFSSADEQFRSATGDPLLRCAREIVAGEYSKVTKAFTYRYNQRNPTGASPLVEHAAENWMMFLGTNTGFNGSTTFTQLTPEENAFAEELIAYWLSFVRSHDPNTFKLARSPVWQPFTNEKHPRIVLQQNTTTTSGSYTEVDYVPEIKRCAAIAGKVKTMLN
ncbi:hypothetical protein QCA50_013194 [Cerrena zonata]|uniref:Carboxylic ester hydrolase n=1 Tax=Cerrena zonata TaxID=2478898 RepID=A0AAW0FRZ2_9APHY